MIKKSLSIKEILDSHNQPTRRCAANLFEDKMNEMLNRLGVDSFNFEIPPLHKKLEKSDDWFVAIEQVLFEWKHSDIDEEADNESVL